MDPRISIITSCFNAGSTISALMESILAQSTKPAEHILIDGGSTDNTVEVIRSFESRYKQKGIDLSWISERDEGIYDAWNKGLKMASGSWIAFIGADDSYPKHALHVLSQKTDPSRYDFVTGKCEFVRNGEVVRKYGEPWSWDVFRKEMKILHAGGLHNADYFRRFGNFNANYKIAGDYELLLRAGRSLRVYFVDEITVFMGDAGVSSSKIVAVLNEARNAKVENGARSELMAAWDMLVVYLKIKLKRFVGR